MAHYACCCMAILLATGCVTVGLPPQDVEFSDDAVVLTVPIVLQDARYDCGVSALSMLLAYYSHPCEEEKAAVLRAQAAREEGLTGADLQQYMVAEGFDARLFAGTLSHEIEGLYYHLDRGRPLVAALGSSGGTNHFVLVTGYDPVNQWILLQDPQRGALVYSTVQFERAWQSARSFTLLATPAE